VQPFAQRYCIQPLSASFIANARYQDHRVSYRTRSTSDIPLRTILTSTYIALSLNIYRSLRLCRSKRSKHCIWSPYCKAETDLSHVSIGSSPNQRLTYCQACLRSERSTAGLPRTSPRVPGAGRLAATFCKDCPFTILNVGLLRSSHYYAGKCG
jgi:hypothetical protein